MRIIFMGTPDFAVPSLQAIINAGYEVAAVVTVPDKPTGRGQKITKSPVKLAAEQHNIPVLQPEKLKDEAFIAALRDFQADLQVVVAFRMLPEAVWNMPRLGTYNLHASLLPRYRGAAPINHAIINGDKITGVTTFKLQHEIDTGDILLQKQININDDDNAGTIHDKLMNIGADAIVESLRLIDEADKNSTPLPLQPQKGETTPAPKLFRENTQINWNQPANQIHNFVRGLAPYPAAWTELPQLGNVKIFETQLSKRNIPVGQLQTDNKTYIAIGTANGQSLDILRLQAPAKKAMNVRDFLNGTHLV